MSNSANDAFLESAYEEGLEIATNELGLQGVAAEEYAELYAKNKFIQRS